jgi:hypothetical protein
MEEVELAVVIGRIVSKEAPAPVRVFGEKSQEYPR